MIKLISILVAALLIPQVLSGQTFQDFLNQAYASPDSLRQPIVNAFVASNPQTPLIEFDTLVHFYYKGAGTSVSVPGDANSWNPASDLMARIPSTDFWYVSKSYEDDARLDYKYVLNGTTWILDPRNPRTVSGGFGPNSELSMPAYPPAPEIQFYPGIPHGSLTDTVVFSSSLGNSRTVRVYTPPNYSTSSDSFPVILIHDGLEYVSLAQANNVLDYLINLQLIEPVLAVFVPPVNRTQEYAGSQQALFTSFIVNELMPLLDQRYRTRRAAMARAVLGASNGGNISLWIGYNHPDVFGNIAAQSSNIQSSISSGFQTSPLLPLKLYLDLGTYDIPVLIPLVRNFIPILQSKGYPYQYFEFHEGHSWGNWRAHLDNALKYFFPGPAASIGRGSQTPKQHILVSNYPNPFNPGTVIEYSIPQREHTTLRIFDILGRDIGVLVDEIQDAGTYQVRWRPEAASSGVFYYQIISGESSVLKAMVLVK